MDGRAGPSDEELCSACSALLLGVDLATITTRQARQLLTVKFGVDLESRKAFIKQQARDTRWGGWLLALEAAEPACVPSHAVRRRVQRHRRDRQVCA